MSARVTIGIPVYNGADTLRQAVESALAQTRPADLIHISDNASTDGTAAVGRELAVRHPSVIYTRHDASLGLSGNFAHVLDRADTEYFMWLAADDYIEAAYVERALAASGHYTPEMDRAAVARSISVLNSYGVTAFIDAASMQPIMAALKGLDDRGELTAWAVCAMPVVEPGFMFGKAGEELFALREDYRGAHVKPDYVKVFLDGVPGAKTAAFHEPYLADPVRGCCFRGATMLTVPDLIRWLGRCEKLGLAAKIHCAGDAAVTQALDAIDVVRSFNGPTNLIHQIAHASYIAPDDIRRFAELGVAADLSPIIWYPTIFLEAHKAAMGEERAQRFWPNKDLKEAGALMAGGSDWPVIPIPDPWQGIEGMVTRQNPTGDFPGKSLWAEQALDLKTVIDIYTIDAARAAGLGQSIGSIEVGKSADLIVLDQMIFDVPPDQLADTRVEMTFFEGRRVYERGE